MRSLCALIAKSLENCLDALNAKLRYIVRVIVRKKHGSGTKSNVGKLQPYGDPPMACHGDLLMAYQGALICRPRLQNHMNLLCTNNGLVYAAFVLSLLLFILLMDMHVVIQHAKHAMQQLAVLC